MCTKIIVKDKANNVVSLRTMEASMDLQYEMRIVPRNYSMPMSTNPEIQGLGEYKTKYAVLAAVDKEGFYGSKTVFHEVINEKGLSISGNAFRKVCKYPLKDAKDFVEGDFDGEQLINYVATTCANLDDVKKFFNEEYKDRIFLETKFAPYTTHFSITDGEAKSIVVESTNGKFEIIDNPMNVMTNAPTIQSHFANLSNYMHLSPYEAKNEANFQNEQLGDYTDMSSGTGANGLPGNSYSMSRFIRGSFFQRTIVLDDNINNTMRAVWSIANNFDIPFGSNRELVNPAHRKVTPESYWIWSDKDKDEVIDQSVLTMVQNQTAGIVQYKDWKNNSIREINMHDYDLDGDKIYSVAVYEDESIPVQKVTLK